MVGKIAIPLHKMMRILLVLIGLQAQLVFSQMFLNELGNILGSKPYFNEEFVMKNSIKSMHGSYWTKAELDYMYPSPDFVYFEFNLLGQLIYEKRGKHLDTTEVHYTYYNNSTISRILKRDKYGYHVYSFSYDNQKRILQTTYYQQRTPRELGETYDQNKATLVSDETFDYQELSEIMYKKIYLNSTGKAYKDEFYHWDGQNQLLRQESKLKQGTGITEVDYHYDSKGRVTEKSSLVKFINSKVTKWEYSYDDAGNVESIKEYKNDFYLTEYQLVYKPDQSLKAIIKRNVPSNFITIVKFEEYQYFSKF